MQYFWDWAVMPLLKNRGVRSVLEIGASQGGNTDRMLHQLPGVRLTVIDPCLDADLVAKYRNNPSVTVIKDRSIDALKVLNGSFDAILMDGDHNYYTVLSELRSIASRKLLAQGGMILFHDIGAPYGREDLFYEPERIPAAAKAAGQPQGVLTAIEAFRIEGPAQWRWMQWNSEHGLGCLYDPRSPFDPAALTLKTVAWRSIRWSNRILRWTGLKRPDQIAWGPLNKP